MGNCLRHESEMHWAGEDWDDFIRGDDDHHHSSKTSREAKKVIVTGNCKSSDPTHEIKIKLTKKQFQDLLSKVNVHGLTFHQQAFSCPSSINRKTDGYEEANQQGRLWRPVLKSIPEVN